MATGIIKSSYKTGRLLANATYVTTNKLDVKQEGRTVIINGYVDVTANAGFTAGTLDGVSVPNNQSPRFIVAVSNQAYNPPQYTGYGSIGINGELYLNLPTTGAKSVYFSVSYMI